MNDFCLPQEGADCFARGGGSTKQLEKDQSWKKVEPDKKILHNYFPLNTQWKLREDVNRRKIKIMDFLVKGWNVFIYIYILNQIRLFK